jgi:hypothetical protein
MVKAALSDSAAPVVIPDEQSPTPIYHRHSVSQFYESERTTPRPRPHRRKIARKLDVSNKSHPDWKPKTLVCLGNRVKMPGGELPFLESP